MQKLFDWLHIEPTGRSLWWFLVKMLFLIWVLQFLTQMLLHTVGVPIPNDPELPLLKEKFFVIMLFSVPFAVFMEEAVWRLLLVLPLAFIVESKARPKVLLVSTLLLSMIFGYIHKIPGGIPSILLQGVGGLLLSVVFLKCGGLQGKYWKALGASTCVHIVFNWIPLFIELARQSL